MAGPPFESAQPLYPSFERAALSATGDIDGLPEIAVAYPRTGVLRPFSAPTIDGCLLQQQISTTPCPSGAFIATQPGDTWFFQAWHRDTAASGGATSSFTTAVELTFE